MAVSDTYIVMPIVVHEFVTHAVPEEELDRPQELEKRCCLFRMRVPPDQLNPQVCRLFACRVPQLADMESSGDMPWPRMITACMQLTMGYAGTNQLLLSLICSHMQCLEIKLLLKFL